MIQFPPLLDLSDLLQVAAAPRRVRDAGRFDGAQSLVVRRSLAGLSQQLGVARAALERLLDEKAAVAASSARSRVALASSASPLALAAIERSTRLSSSEEINAIATSFSPFGPAVSGTTTSLPTIGGVYSGAQGDDTLTFEFRQNTVVGSGQRLNVRVFDGSSSRIETLRFEGLPAGTAVSLSNGLTLSLGAGDVARNDTFTVQVSASVGSQVDPSKPFDGARNEQPNFEPGTSVVGGTFEVNGAVIAVAADDSIESVLAKINASSAGVTASFDAASESVVLSQDTPGPTPTIVLANDTSGFLAATKLSGATPVQGQDQTFANDPIGEVPALAGVSDGAFSVNGVVFSIDTASDTLEGVIARIDASAAGAIATLDGETSALSIRSRSQRNDLILDDGTSGFFAAVGIAPTVHRPILRADVGSSGFQRLSAVQENLSELRSVLSGLLRPAAGRISELGVVRDRLSEAIASSFESVLDISSRGALRSGFGLDFDFTQERVVLEIDRDDFEQASIDSFEALHDFLFLEDEHGRPEGLLVSLDKQIDSLQSFVERRMGLLEPKGRIVDLVG